MKKTVRYYGLDAWLKARHGEKVQKIPLDAGSSCPNRDGTLGFGGCTFCNAIGSGSGRGQKNMPEQWAYWRTRFAASDRLKHTRLFLGYLQAFTNTYGPPDRLRAMLAELRALPGLIGVCVGTRPDCLDEEKLDILAACSQGTPAQAHGEQHPTAKAPLPPRPSIGFSPDPGPILAPRPALKAELQPEPGPELWPELWLELGIQSCHNATLARINRGHDVATSERAIHLAASRNLKVCAHLMAGLPGENSDDFLDTVRWVAALPVAGVKLHGLYVPEGTLLEKDWRQGKYTPLEHEEYVDMVARALTLLPSHMVIHRLTADPAPGELLAPAWASQKGESIRMLDRLLDERNWWQGCAADVPEANPWARA